MSNNDIPQYIEPEAFNFLPNTMQFKNLNGLVIFASGVITNAEGKAYRQFEKKASAKSKTPSLKIAVRTEKYSWKQLSVARLVAELFVPNPQNLRHVRQKDGNFRNCDHRNLEWFDHASRDNRRKMTEKELQVYVKKLKPSKLSKMGDAMYHYLKGVKRPFITIFYEEANQKYCYSVLKNAINDGFSDAKYPTDYIIRSLRDHFNEIVEGLILRGYFLPREYCDDAVYWIYVRSYLNGLAKQYCSNPRTREKINFSRLRA